MIGIKGKDAIEMGLMSTMGATSAVVLLLVLLHCAFSIAKDAFVETPLGPVQGFKYVTPDGTDTEIFLGLPFAEPPVDEHRFEKTAPVKPWKDTLSADKFGPHCATHNPIFFPGEEDCLYLNIFKPKEPSNDANGYPVLIWIHGGAYVFGGTEFYGYENITNNFVAKGVIVASITYRLGPFGFFSSGDDRLPGNLGLWDQREAILFLRKVLPSFGGDIDRITLMGHSAGSGSVSWLSASPQSNELFAQAIEMSGSVFAHWSSTDEVLDWSRDVAKAAGCDYQGSDLKKCLKDSHLDLFHALGKNWPPFRTGETFAYFNPRVDGEFFGADSFEHAFEHAPPKPTLFGLTTQEGLLWSAQLLPFFPEDRPFFLSPHSASHYTRHDLTTYIRHFTATEEKFGRSALEIANSIIEFYTAGETKDSGSAFYFERYTQLLSDILFALPVLRELKVKSNLGYPTYLYLYDHDLPKEVTKFTIDGTPHAAEWNALFGKFFFGEFEYTDTDKVIQANFVNSLVNFVKTGKPNTGSLEFPQTSAKGLEYVRINANPQVEKSLFSERYNFWQSLGRKYGYDFNLGRRMKKAELRRSEL
uniref:Carboxylic ester hydrolase n=1 Tax=Panagrellus redivivus TaxID=6233 RepID=A0A7E4VQZ9_PANRE